MDKQQGTVAHVSVNGYAFIKPDDGGRDLFAHDSQLRMFLEPWARVEFEIGSNHRGPCAVEVSRIGFAIGDSSDYRDRAASP